MWNILYDGTDKELLANQNNPIEPNFIEFRKPVQFPSCMATGHGPTFTDRTWVECLYWLLPKPSKSPSTVILPLTLRLQSASTFASKNKATRFDSE